MDESVSEIPQLPFCATTLNKDVYISSKNCFDIMFTQISAMLSRELVAFIEEINNFGILSSRCMTG